MSEENYLELLSILDPVLKKQDTVLRQSISSHERLTAMLRFLATWCSYEDLKFSTCISPQALGQINNNNSGSSSRNNNNNNNNNCLTFPAINIL